MSGFCTETCFFRTQFQLREPERSVSETPRTPSRGLHDGSVLPRSLSPDTLLIHCCRRCGWSPSPPSTSASADSAQGVLLNRHNAGVAFQTSRRLNRLMHGPPPDFTHRLNNVSYRIFFPSESDPGAESSPGPRASPRSPLIWNFPPQTSLPPKGPGRPGRELAQKLLPSPEHRQVVRGAGCADRGHGRVGVGAQL